MIDLTQAMVMTVIPLRSRSRRRPHTSTSPPQPTLVEQWASLLELLSDGCASISTSVEQMAEDVPRDLIAPVNAQLREQFEEGRPLLDEGGLGRTGAGVGPSAGAAPEGNHGHDHRLR